MSEKTGLAERLRAMDPRIVYTLLILVVVVPTLYPLGLPIPINATTRALYSMIDALPQGSVVWYGIDYNAVNAAELLPGQVATTQHLLNKPVRVVFVSFQPDGPMVYHKAMALVKVPPGKKYGVDYVYLGFIPGDEPAIAGMANDVKMIAKTDYLGTPVESLAVLKDIKTAKDFSVVVTCVAVPIVSDFYLRQVFARYGVKVALVTTGVNYPERLTFYPHQFVGILNGMLGGAEYEQLTRNLGSASSAMDAFSMAQILLIVLVLVANVGLLASRKKGKGGT